MTTTDRPYTLIENLEASLSAPRDGIVSRTLYADARVRLVSFAFDAGQELTEHSAAVPAIIHVVRGRAELALGDDPSVEVRSGALVHMRAGLRHALKALEPTVMLLTMLKGAP